MFCAFERSGNRRLPRDPLGNWRELRVTERRTRLDSAHFVRDLVDVRYEDADKVVLVMDNLNTHSPASLYDAFTPEEARGGAADHAEAGDPLHAQARLLAERRRGRTQRDGPPPPDRVPDAAALAAHATAVAQERNAAGKGCDWQFATPDARIKPKRLYPSIEVR